MAANECWRLLGAAISGAVAALLIERIMRRPTRAAVRVQRKSCTRRRSPRVQIRSLEQGDTSGRLSVLAGYRGVMAAEGKDNVPPEHMMFVTNSLDKLLRDGGGGVLMCEDVGGAFLGYIWWVLSDSTPFGPDGCYGPWNESFIYVHTVFTEPAARRQGVGTALYEALQRVARDLGVQQVCLDVFATNPSSVAFHESLGFAAMTTIFEMRQGSKSSQPRDFKDVLR